MKEKNLEEYVPKEPYELFGVECGDGWKKLYQPILDYANEHHFEILQVKEKFGGLRIYLGAYDDIVRKMIEKAEESSYNTCEICGKYIDKPIVKGSWIYPECEECYNKIVEENKKRLEAFAEKMKKNREKDSSES